MFKISDKIITKTSCKKNQEIGWAINWKGEIVSLFTDYGMRVVFENGKIAVVYPEDVSLIKD